jgi:uncharacterized protein YabN with tetrapyrrole methylase and pyrophosphatase domain
MKKNLFFVFTMLCALSFFTACSDDDDNKTDDGWKAISATYTAETLKLTMGGTEVADQSVKVDEELAEFHAETNPEKKEQELGDVFFSLINYARISGLNADSALERTNLKFIKRFQTLEKLALEKNLNLAEMSLEEMDILWEEAKKTV